MLGGSAWLSVPLGLASTLGIGAIVLEPLFPGGPLSAADIAGRYYHPS